MSKTKKITISIAIGFVSCIAVSVIALYLWPLQDTILMSASSQKLSYTETNITFAETQQHEKADQGLKPACQSRLYDHGQKTNKAILMLHGYTACPDQFSSLAETFFNLGYNVYVPLVPHHGRFAYIIPDEWQLGHDIVSPEGEDIKGRSSDLYQTYVRLYETKLNR